MQPHILIQRRANELANARMGEVFLAFLDQVDTPNIKKLVNSFIPCSCEYCRTHITYTYFCMRVKQDPKIVNYHIKVKELKAIKLKLVQDGVVSPEHVTEAKQFIGKNFASFRNFVDTSGVGRLTYCSNPTHPRDYYNKF